MTVLPWTVDDKPPPLLTVAGLGISFGPVRALNGVNLTVQPGELIALAGENGAGKTTLVRCIAGDIAPASGEISWPAREWCRSGGRRPARDRGGLAGPSALRQPGHRGQHPARAGGSRRLMLSENRFHAEAASVLREPAHPAQGHHPECPHAVRRAAPARGRGAGDAPRPRLLALDEPTASLGVREAAQVETLITGLREQGTTILLASPRHRPDVPAGGPHRGAAAGPDRGRPRSARAAPR